MNSFNTKPVALAGLLSLGMGGQQTAAAADTKNENANKPNFIVIFADDLGYGDLGIFGHPAIKTPNLDKMAVEGQKWTSFYVAAPVSTPSRAGLLTGRLPIRSGMCSDKRRVLFPDSNGGLPQSEITIARVLKESGYQTAHPVANPPMEITNTPTVHETPLLYNLNVDPSEKFNIAEEHPEIIEELRKVLEEHLAGIEQVENQLEK